jgi:hypothetical protein
MSISTIINALIEMVAEFPLPIPPSSIINLPIISRPLIFHYGSEAKYERFSNSYFAKITDDGSIIKHKIISVKYRSDDLYRTTDGMSGKCWLVLVIDEFNCRNTYYIRNWHDIADHYTTTYGMEFVEL